MAITMDMEEERTPEIGEKMRIDRTEEVEERGAIGVIEKTEEVTVERVGIMGAQEPVIITMEATETADQGKALEESARGLQANGSLL